MFSEVTGEWVCLLCMHHTLPGTAALDGIPGSMACALEIHSILNDCFYAQRTFVPEQAILLLGFSYARSGNGLWASLADMCPCS